jgi:hypothetical protein
MGLKAETKDNGLSKRSENIGSERNLDLILHVRAMREKDGVGMSPLLQVVLPVFGVKLVIFRDFVGLAQAVEVLANVIDRLKMNRNGRKLVNT